MGLVIFGLISIVLGCLILGDPYTLLLSSGGYWIAMAAIMILCVISNRILNTTFKELNIAGKVLNVVSVTIMAVIFLSFFGVIFIPSFRDIVIRLIGLGDHLDDFHDIDISAWHYILYGVVQLILLGIYGIQQLGQKCRKKLMTVAKKLNILYTSIKWQTQKLTFHPKHRKQMPAALPKQNATIS